VESTFTDLILRSRAKRGVWKGGDGHGLAGAVLRDARKSALLRTRFL
jgi:hypothetical protein